VPAPQTEVYQEWKDTARLSFYPPCCPSTCSRATRSATTATWPEPAPRLHLRLRPGHPDLFPGFFLADLEENVLPKFELLRQHGFYASKERE